MTLPLTVTLGTSAGLALLGTVVATRVAMARAKYGILIGDGGNADLIARMRSHANFAEYVPLILVQLALLEMSGPNRNILIFCGSLLFLARLLHAVGMALPAPNASRAIGTAATTLLVVFLAGYGLALIFWH